MPTRLNQCASPKGLLLANHTFPSGHPQQSSQTFRILGNCGATVFACVVLKRLLERREVASAFDSTVPSNSVILVIKRQLIQLVCPLRSWPDMSRQDHLWHTCAESPTSPQHPARPLVQTELHRNFVPNSGHSGRWERVVVALHSVSLRTSDVSTDFLVFTHLGATVKCTEAANFISICARPTLSAGAHTHRTLDQTCHSVHSEPLRQTHLSDCVQ